MSTTYGATRLGQAAAKRQVYYSPLEEYWDAFLEWRKRQRLRATLCDLSDRELMDIGTTRGEIDYVAYVTNVPQPEIVNPIKGTGIGVA
jgi:uncharacterized protein YjiS (DUF1127 family)